MITFGTLGAADITPTALLYPCMNEPKASVTVIGARSRSNADGFALYHKIANVVDDYQSVINHPECNAIYNPLPISHHKSWTIAALNAGKHVLCEKSLASNAQEAREMADVAKEKDLVLMDAFHYRYHPMFIRARDIYQSGVLGKIEKIEAAFSVSGIINPEDIRLNFDTGGGVTMDIGCYPISWVRHLTGLEPEQVTAKAEVGPPHVDLMLKADLTLANDIPASILGDMRPNGRFRAEIIVSGSEGSMRVSNPLAPQMGHRLRTVFGNEHKDEYFDRRPTYCYQLDAFLNAINEGVTPFTDAEDAVKQMHVIDQCYRAAGLPLRGENNA
jgi:predicted dehydrogenase